MASFSIFITYYLFIPIIYGAVGLYILYQWKILKNISFKEAVKYISVILVIPFIIGMWYYFISNMFIKSSVSSPVNIFKLDGYIYRNLISNFILILVIIINEFIYNLKHKKINVFDLGILMNIVFIVILFFLFYNDKIASYYYYKLYYPLWTLCFISLGITLLSDIKELKTMSISILSLMFLIFIAQCTDIDNKLYQKNPLLNNTTFINGITDIYWFNNNRSDKNIYESIFSKEELKDITTIYNKYSKELHNNNYYFVGDVMEKLWIYSITRTNPLGDHKELNNFYDEILDINNIESNESINYIIYSFNEKEMYQSYKFTEIYSTKTYILSQRNV